MKKIITLALLIFGFVSIQENNSASAYVLGHKAAPKKIKVYKKKPSTIVIYPHWRVGPGIYLYRPYKKYRRVIVVR